MEKVCSLSSFQRRLKIGEEPARPEGGGSSLQRGDCVPLRRAGLLPAFANQAAEFGPQDSAS